MNSLIYVIFSVFGYVIIGFIIKKFLENVKYEAMVYKINNKINEKNYQNVKFYGLTNNQNEIA